MAEKFKFPSTDQFAAEILRRDSTQRLAWLREYYVSMNYADLADVVTDNIPEPVSAQTSSPSTATSLPSTKTSGKKGHTENRSRQKDPSRATKSAKYTQRNPEPRTKPGAPQNNVHVPQIRLAIPQNDVLELPKKQKISQKNVLDPLQDVPGPESEEQKEMVCTARGHKRTKRGNVSSSGACKALRGLGEDRAVSSGLGSVEAAAFLNHTDKDAPSSSDLSHCSSATLSKPAAQGREQDQKPSARSGETLQERREDPQSSSTSRNHSFITDLIGDTSILDDLLKPKPKSAQQRSTPRTPHTSSVSRNTSLVSPSSSVTFLPDSGSCTQTAHQVTRPAQMSKGTRKDIWDILNEGNEDSINRLTDPEEVERVCIKSNFASRSSPGQRERKSLWKTNDKFLWKK